MPAIPEKISNEWLTSILADGRDGGDEVVDSQIEPIGVGVGIFGQLARASLTWRDGAGKPSSVIIKRPCAESENLAVAQALGLYEREVNFFNSILPRVQLRAPHCYLAQFDSPDFIIVMEDMGGELTSGDQIVGASYTQAAAFVDELVKLHTVWWESDELAQMKWLPNIAGEMNLASVPAIYSGCIEPLETWRQRLPKGSIELCQRLDPHFRTLMTRMGEAPPTVAHGDTRWDNVFYNDDDPPEVTVIDFQICTRAPGVNDVAYFVCNSLKLEEQDTWQTLLEHWHKGITAQGIDYSWDDCLLHYKRGALYTLVGAITLVDMFDTGNERGAEMTSIYLERIFTHLLSIGAEEVIDAL